LPADWKLPDVVLPEQLYNLALITVHPEYLSPTLLGRVDLILAVGENAGATLNAFCNAAGVPTPPAPCSNLEPGEALLWWVRGDRRPRTVRVHPPRTERRRHRRKYAEGELPPDRSFFFRGPAGKLNLRAQNLALFLQTADGVDDETWEFHRRRGDYSRWFLQCIKDDDLAAAAEQVEHLERPSPAESRALIRTAIERDYVPVASGPLPVPGAS
jgi:hypothetical protein